MELKMICYEKKEKEIKALVNHEEYTFPYTKIIEDILDEHTHCYPDLDSDSIDKIKNLPKQELREKLDAALSKLNSRVESHINGGFYKYKYDEPPKEFDDLTDAEKIKQAEEVLGEIVTELCDVCDDVRNIAYLLD
jgi:hypothetical protein